MDPVDLPQLMTGLFALGGVGLGAWLRWLSDKATQDRAAEQRSWEARRDAYVQLLQALDRLQSALDGIAVSARASTVPADTTRAATEAAAVAEFHAPPNTWARMKPYVDVLAMSANRFAVQSGRARLPHDAAAEALQFIKAHGADKPEGRMRLRNELLAAAREDLGL